MKKRLSDGFWPDLAGLPGLSARPLLSVFLPRVPHNEKLATDPLRPFTIMSF
jgi:hypothetical protein